MIEHIYTNVEFMDGALKRVIVEALDRAFKNTRGRVPLTFKDEEIGYCFKYVNEKGFNLYAMIDSRDYETKKIGFNLTNVSTNKEGTLVKAEIYNVIAY